MLRVLQALFNLHTLVSLDCYTKDLNIFDWSIECLVTASFVIVDVFTNDFPVFDVECFLAKNFIRIKETIQYESAAYC